MSTHGSDGESDAHRGNGSGNGIGHVTHDSALTIHHIIPSSRVDGQVAIIPRRIHEIFHWVFGNLKPREVIIWLVEKVWGGCWDYVEEALAWKRARDLCPQEELERQLSEIESRVRLTTRMPDGRRPRRQAITALIEARRERQQELQDDGISRGFRDRGAYERRETADP